MPGGPVDGGHGPGRSATGEPHSRAHSRDAGVDWPSTSQDDKNAGWLIIGYLVAGMLIYGGLGWLVGQWTGAVRIATLIGVLAGLVLALALVIYRYGRS